MILDVAMHTCPWWKNAPVSREMYSMIYVVVCEHDHRVFPSKLHGILFKLARSDFRNSFAHAA